jgi:hypothetical protein
MPSSASLLQALKAQRGPQTVDPEFLKMMAQTADPGSHHVSTSGGGGTETRHDSSATDEAAVYQPARVLHTMGVVAAAGVVAGELLVSCVLEHQRSVSCRMAALSCKSCTPASCCVNAGMLGIAGAMLFNPFLLAKGVHPQVVAATAIVIVLFGSGAISLSFM